VRGRPWGERAPRFGAQPGAGLRRRRGSVPGARACERRQRGSAGERRGRHAGGERLAQAGERAQAARPRRGERRAALARGRAGEVRAAVGAGGGWRRGPSGSGQAYGQRRVAGAGVSGGRHWKQEQCRLEQEQAMRARRVRHRGSSGAARAEVKAGVVGAQMKQHAASGHSGGSRAVQERT
jgi:hypothetical protein